MTRAREDITTTRAGLEAMVGAGLVVLLDGEGKPCPLPADGTEGKLFALAGSGALYEVGRQVGVAWKLTKRMDDAVTFTGREGC